MWYSETEHSIPEEPFPASQSEAGEEEGSLSLPSAEQVTEALARTQLHSRRPHVPAEPAAAEGDPFAETQRVQLENQKRTEAQSNPATGGGQSSSPLQDAGEEAEALAATLPVHVTLKGAAETAAAGETRTSGEGQGNYQATQAMPVSGIDHEQPPPVPPIQAKDKKSSPLRWVVFLGIVGLIGVALLSAIAGYASGISARKEAAATQAGLVAKEQYELALQEIANKEYGRARQRLEYVIQLVPDYPGAAEKLAEVIFEASITATPTIAPSPTLSPTPDLRGAEERLEAAKQQIFNSQWAEAIDTLLLLRKAEPNFQPALVDDLLYLAYRNSGREKILKEANLEGGIYDLTLAEKFGPLDTETKGLQTWARLYLLGASYWDVDWGQVVYYFAQVAPAVPNLRDGSGWTATERYRIALGKYAEQLLARKEWCSAMEMYQQALSYGGDQALQEGYNRAYEKCVGSQITPTEAAPPAEVPTETPQP